MSVEFKKTGIIQATPIADTSVVTINKNSMSIQPNLILDSNYVTSGSNASGITSEYLSDGTLKIVSTSGNGNYRSLGFARNSNTSVGNGLAVGDSYSISLDMMVEVGTALPTLFINSGNSYKQLKCNQFKNGVWMRVWYSSTWATPGTSYGNISLHLGFSSAIGTYYVKNFKLEKSATPTLWIPNSTDSVYTKYGYANLTTSVENIAKLYDILEN